MPLPPAIPVSGIAGLRFLDRTYDRQFENFNRSPDVAREIAYFEENAGQITLLDQLMGDRRILSVVLGAFGLDEDLDKRAFIRKVLDEGTLDPSAFANRLAEPAYREMAAFIGFGDEFGKLDQASVRTEIVDRFKERQFELSVGTVDLDLRLAMNFRREAANIAETATSDTNGWLRLLGSRPLRSVIEGALNLPSQFASVDLDQQVAEVEDRAERLFDIESPKDLLEDGKLERMVDRFLANSQLANGVIGSSVRGATALTLLQSGGLGFAGQSNLFASNFI